MDDAPFGHLVESEDDLRSITPEPGEAVLRKIIGEIDEHCASVIAVSPLVMLATHDQDGRCDVSPRGGAPGFVQVLDRKRLLLPEASGNRIVDSQRNIIATNRIGLCFLIPGLGETLRVNGRAWLTTDPELLAPLEGREGVPKAGIGVEVEEAFLHCAKALIRSRAWKPETWAERGDLPRPAAIWSAHIALAELTPDAVEAWVEPDYDTVR